MTRAGETAHVELLPDGRYRISVKGESKSSGPRQDCTTAYPLALIREIYATKGAYVCDEIMREEDPGYVERSIRHEVLGYIGAPEFAGKRILDFGCGAGASASVLSRLLPPCEIVGIELEERLLRLARLRVEHLGRHGVRFLRSPAPDRLPPDVGEFDFIMLNAVYEHLLPQERRTLLPRIWGHLRPGGVLFLNQTPHRYSPVELHTTGLPLINYLPDGLAMRFARRFSGQIQQDAGWEQLLRAGIRGATVREILGILAATDGAPALLAPRKSVGDRIDLWYGKLSRRHRWLKRTIWASLKGINALTGIELTPQLALAIRKAGRFLLCEADPAPSTRPSASPPDARRHRRAFTMRGYFAAC